MNTDIAAQTGGETARKYFQEILNGKNLPSLPVVANTILKMIQDPDVNIQKLCRLMADDTALAARVLAMSRSPQYGQRSLPTTLISAVKVLGFRTLAGIVVSNATRSLCLGGKTAETLWNHSLGVALTMRIF